MLIRHCHIQKKHHRACWLTWWQCVTICGFVCWSCFQLSRTWSIHEQTRFYNGEILRGIHGEIPLWNPQWNPQVSWWKITMVLPWTSSIFWLVVSTPLKNISQLGWLFPIYGKIKVMFQTTKSSIFHGEQSLSDLHPMWKIWSQHVPAPSRPRQPRPQHLESGGTMTCVRMVLSWFSAQKHEHKQSSLEDCCQIWANYEAGDKWEYTRINWIYCKRTS